MLGTYFDWRYKALNRVNKQRQLLSRIDGLRTDAQELAVSVQSLERRVMARSVELACASGDMAYLKESVTVAQRRLADVQLALSTVESECEEYHRRSDSEKQQRCVLEALLRNLCRSLIDHKYLVNSVLGFFCRDVDLDPDAFCGLFLPRCTTVRHAFVLRRSPLSRQIERRLIKLFRPSSCISMVVSRL